MLTVRQFILCLMLAAAWPCQAELLYDSVQGAGGVPLNVVSAGDPANPAILFIHGLGQSHYSFIHQLESDLTSDFFLVAFDLRGHGESGKPWNVEAYADYRSWGGDVNAVMTALGVRQPVVVAWSYGGFVLMDYMREFGSADLTGVIFTGTLGGVAPFRLPPADDAKAAEFAQLRLLQVSPDFPDKLKAASGVVGMLTAEPVAEPYRQLFTSIRFMLPAYAQRHMFARSLDNQDLLQELNFPVLLSMGAKDNAAMLEDAVALEKTHDNFALSIFTEAGHSVFFEQPQRFNAELREFAVRLTSIPEPIPE